MLIDFSPSLRLWLISFLSSSILLEDQYLILGCLRLNQDIQVFIKRNKEAAGICIGSGKRLLMNPLK